MTPSKTTFIRAALDQKFTNVLCEIYNILYDVMSLTHSAKVTSQNISVQMKYIYLICPHHILDFIQPLREGAQKLMFFYQTV